MTNKNKVISCEGDKMSILYTDSNKHFVCRYDNSVQTVVKKSENKRHFSSEQQKIFRQALHGLALYNQKSLSKMTFQEKNLIVNMHNKTVRFLNDWKQELADNIVDNFLIKLFPNSKQIKSFLMYSGQKDSRIITAEFKELGVNQYKIAEKLVHQGILPNNFFHL